jgi:hypothetical protein
MTDFYISFREIDQTLMVTGKKGVIYKVRVRDLADESLIQNATVSATYVGYVRNYFHYKSQCRIASLKF